MTIHCGKVHKYLGMKIDYSMLGKVSFSMLDYINKMIGKCPNRMVHRTVQTPASAHLFEVNKSCKKLGPEEAVIYHHLTAKLLYLCWRTCPDLQLAVAFLTTRVKALN